MFNRSKCSKSGAKKPRTFPLRNVRGECIRSAVPPKFSVPNMHTLKPPTRLWPLTLPLRLTLHQNKMYQANGSGMSYTHKHSYRLPPPAGSLKTLLTSYSLHCLCLCFALLVLNFPTPHVTCYYYYRKRRRFCQACSYHFSLFIFLLFLPRML